MIREEKYFHALYALHQISVQGRFMAYTKEPYKDIAELLDYAEIMPEFIASEIDETEKFADYLKEIGERFLSCRGLLNNFNSTENPYEFLKSKNERTI